MEILNKYKAKKKTITVRIYVELVDEIKRRIKEKGVNVTYTKVINDLITQNLNDSKKNNV